MKRDPCKFIHDNLMEVMSDMIDITLSDGVETGVYVFDVDGDVKRTNIQKGKRTGIVIRRIVRKGNVLGSPLATIHTHPNKRFDRYFSVRDIKTMIKARLPFAVLAFKDSEGKQATVFTPEKFHSFEGLKSHTFESRFREVNRVNKLRFLKAINDELRECTFNI